MAKIMRPKIVVIAGPTASGKSALAIRLAANFGGEIVSADSMQVYRDMDIGTAKPTREERVGIPHHMLDVVDPDEEFNAALYRSMAYPISMDLCGRGKLCLLVGGTGLYIKSLLGGLSFCPPADRSFRESLRRECGRHGSMHLYRRLEQLDPGSAGRIHPNDVVRIIRALEIIHLTNRRASDLNREHNFGDAPFRALKICMMVEREDLYRRIDERCEDMMDAGLVQETERLLARGYTPDLSPMKSIGYRHMIKYIKGKWTLDEALHNLQKDTRRYAKRQMTWFRGDPGFEWISPADFDIICSRIETFMYNSL